MGDARIVSLDEATHGTREFFQMKHRILRFLVERMGFAAFGIEATWPAASRLDRHVRTGEGDPAVLLSGLYFWTWNTEEVLQMIRWMRRHNESGGSVGFYEFDMQFPGMAIDNVALFVAAVDRAASAEFAQRYECLARYANDATGRSPSPRYAEPAATYGDACVQDLRWVQDTLLSRRARYEAASSPVEWAHNGHVSSSSGATMGGSLRQMFGQAMVVMGFSFAQGTFNAVGVTGTTYTSLGPHTVSTPKYDSYEEYFSASRMPRFFLDLTTASVLLPFNYPRSF